MKYEPPYTYQELVKNYGKDLADKLAKDPIHAWRMKTGIELIHKEPTLDEQERIWENWQLMSDEQKKLSDDKSIEFFGMNNATHHKQIMMLRWNKFNNVYESTMKPIIASSYNPHKSPMLQKRLILESFSYLCRKLIEEDYKIFPVPHRLLYDMLIDIKILNFLNSKKYFLKDYINDWEYYEVFNSYVKQNEDCQINVIAYEEKDIYDVIKKYNIDVDTNEFFESFAYIESAGENKANLCVRKTVFEKSLKKAIQHELIHWMQAYLNYDGKTYGKFDRKQFNLTDEQVKWLSKYFGDIEETFNYFYDNENEFEAWTANTCEEFEETNWSIDWFEEVIQDKDKFSDMIIKNSSNKGLIEMLLFSEICYLTSMNDPSDDRWWYLIEALKENGELNA